MKSCYLILLALLLPPQRWTATVTGTILDRESKPLANATVQYTNVAIVQTGGPAADVSTPRMLEGTGRVYKVKTDKKGNFIMLGVDYGVYQIEITAPDGSHVYSGKRRIGDNSDVNSQNDLKVDLSTVGLAPAGAETNLGAGKKTKEQLELIRQENS